MRIYSSNNSFSQLPVSTFLDLVHKDMYNKHSQEFMGNQQEEAQAKELQAFFQQLKTQANGEKATNNVISAITADYILKKVQEKTNWKNPIFSQFGGYNLEKQLYQIIESVYEMSNIDNFFNDIYTGTQHGTIFLEEKFNNFTKKALKDLTGKTAIVLENKSQENNQKYPYMMASVQRKTDIQGGNYQIDIDWQESYGFKRILALLNQATFSAKNYSKFNQWKELQEKGLKLGQSNPYRAVYATLSFLGYNAKTINSAFFAAYNSVSRNLANSDNISAHIYHLRFIYELTGIGMNLIKQVQKGERAKFIIYNEPDSPNIYDVSTAKIIVDMLNSFMKDTKGPGLQAFTSGIYLNRSIFNGEI